MSITAAKLQAEVGADTKGFDTGMAHADKTVAAAPSKWGKALKLGAGVGLGIAAGVVVKGAFGAISAGLDSLKRQGVVVAQTNAVLKSTGAVSHETAAGIRDLSNAIEAKTAIDDKDVQAGANMLLTFTNIRNEVGKGNDIFDQSVGILADLSTAMGTDMKSGAIQLGKALNDPLTGITALTRVGVTFSAQQIEQIKNFEKVGKTAEAQKVILAELNKEFGGSGAAFAATDAGKAAKFQDAIEGIQQSIATGLLPVVTRVRDSLTGFLSDPATLGQAEALGNAIAGIFSENNLRTAANLMTGAAGAISTAIHLFTSLPSEVQALAVGAIALKKITGIGPLDIVKGASGLLKIAFERGATPANPLFVADVAGGAAGVAGAVEGAAGTSLASIAAAVAAPIAAVAAVGTVAAVENMQIHDQSEALKQQTRDYLQIATDKDIASSIDGVRKDLAGMDGLGANAFGQKGTTTDVLNILIAEQNRRAVIQQRDSSVAFTAAGERQEALYGATVAQTNAAEMNARRTEAAENRTSVAVTAAGRASSQHLTALQSAFRTDLHALTAATKANDIQKAAKAIVAEVNKGAGSAKGTKVIIADLQKKLTQTDDPKTRAVLLAAIHSVQAHLPNREWVSGQLHKADAIAKSTESTKTKIIDLTAIQKVLRDRGDTHAAATVGAKVTEMKNRVAQAARDAGNVAANATRHKKWQFTTNLVVPVTVNSQVSLRRYSTATSTASSRGNVYVPS